MNTTIENIVLVNIEDYKELEQSANRTEEHIQRLAEQRAKKIAEDSKSKIRLDFRLHESNLEDLFITVDTWEELTPQLAAVANKIRYWACEVCRKNKEDWVAVREYKERENSMDSKLESYFRSAFWGWSTSIVLLGVLLSVIIFK